MSDPLADQALEGAASAVATVLASHDVGAYRGSPSDALTDGRQVIESMVARGWVIHPGPNRVPELTEALREELVHLWDEFALAIIVATRPPDKDRPQTWSSPMVMTSRRIAALTALVGPTPLAKMHPGLVDWLDSVASIPDGPIEPEPLPEGAEGWVDPGFLTREEHEAMRLLGEAASLIGSIIKGGGQGDQWENDWAEAAHRIHSIQHTVLSQAARRAYPHLYRQLGWSFKAWQAAQDAVEAEATRSGRAAHCPGVIDFDDSIGGEGEIHCHSPLTVGVDGSAVCGKDHGWLPCDCGQKGCHGWQSAAGHAKGTR